MQCRSADLESKLMCWWDHLDPDDTMTTIILQRAMYTMCEWCGCCSMTGWCEWGVKQRNVHGTKKCKQLDYQNEAHSENTYISMNDMHTLSTHRQYWSQLKCETIAMRVDQASEFDASSDMHEWHDVSHHNSKKKTSDKNVTHLGIG